MELTGAALDFPLLECVVTAGEARALAVLLDVPVAATATDPPPEGVDTMAGGGSSLKGELIITQGEDRWWVDRDAAVTYWRFTESKGSLSYRNIGRIVGYRFGAWFGTQRSTARDGGYDLALQGVVSELRVQYLVLRCRC